MKNHRKEFRVSGMITVEMSVIIPVILFIVFLSILGLFYYHDKEIISACAYEAAVVGSTRMREKETMTEAQVTELFEERIRGKTILFGTVKGSAAVSEEKVTVEASASRRRMRVKVSETAAVTEPEKKIRKYRKLGGGRMWNLP